jgi:divalent metal cation (Fe/Co/Zn/Cd) transporter
MQDAGTRTDRFSAIEACHRRCSEAARFCALDTGVTLAWMLVEFGVSVYAAVTAHSPAMLAFGSDSLVELLSATVVLLQWIPSMSISERRASRTAGSLLFVLAFVVAAIAVASLALRLRPATSYAGIAITIAALIAMPVLAFLKRREARRSKNAALAADAVQSATCAYLALIALAGLAINAAFHVAWFDSVAALVAVPILVKEGRSAWQGHACGCC